jgi:hypothetical protein
MGLNHAIWSYVLWDQFHGPSFWKGQVMCQQIYMVINCVCFTFSMFLVCMKHLMLKYGIVCSVPLSLLHKQQNTFEQCVCVYW